MKYSTVKLRIGFTGLWEGIFKDGGGEIFMRNYADRGGPADNLVEIQWVKPPEKDYPWKCFDRQGVGMDEA
jgi:hypothetical protein